MFFVLSKLFWFLIAPSHLFSLLAVTTALCIALRWKRLALVLGLLTALFLAVILSPLPFMALRAIEDQYPRPASVPHVDGILILGSGFNSTLLKERGAPQANSGAYRLVEGFIAARHHPQARVVFTGGSGALGGSEYSEAETARYVLEELGLDPRRLILEPRSRNTYENILFSKSLVKPKPGEVWLLATSAEHMPRAMAIARQLDWPMLPWPTDYIRAPTAWCGWISAAGWSVSIMRRMNGSA